MRNFVPSSAQVKKVHHVFKRMLQILGKAPLFVLAIPLVLLIRLISPWILVRIGNLVGGRIGHFAGNTELYLCERDAGINVPTKRYLDLFFIGRPVANLQLAIMWRRILRVWPVWILAPIYRINGFFPGGAQHDVGHNTQWDRDVHNLLDQSSPHLQFDPKEILHGEAGLRGMGIPEGASFVCLAVRDSAYLERHIPTINWSYHSYRDTDIQNYILAAEELAKRGFYVIRMGEHVREPMKCNNLKVIDYAANGMRNDFMDIYLGAKCSFCITMGTGFDAVPTIFRRPIVFVNSVPVGYLSTFCTRYTHITRRHLLVGSDRELTLREIFSHGVGYCTKTSDYDSRGVQLIENSPEEIRDTVIEMAERLKGTWQPHPDDEALQKRFWEIFPTDSVLRGAPAHGSIRSRYGAKFLRDNRCWLEFPGDVKCDSAEEMLTQKTSFIIHAKL